VPVHLVEHLLTETFQIVEPKKGCEIFRSQRGFLLRPSFSAFAQVNPIAGSATFLHAKTGSPPYPPILPNPSHELSYGLLDTGTFQIVEPKKGCATWFH